MINALIQRYREAFRGVPSDVWLISLILLVSRSGQMVLPFLSIYCSREMEFKPSTIGWVLGSYGIGAVVGGLLGGKLTEWIGSIRTMYLSLGLSVPGYLVVGMAGDFWSLVISLFCLSVVVESLRPACATATINFCDEDSLHTRAMAVNRLAMNLGMTFGPAVGGYLALVSYDYLFYANAFSMFCAFILLLWFFKDKAGQPSKPMWKSDQESAMPTLSPLKDFPFVAFCLLNLLAACVFFQFMGTYPLYLKEQYSLQENHIGLFFAVNTIMIVLFELVLVSAVSGWSLLRIFAWGHFIACVGFGILPFARGSSFGLGLAYCMFGMLVITFGEMLSMPTGPAYVAKRSTPANLGKYMGLYVTSFSLAALIAPIAGMALYDIHPDIVWYISLVVGGIVFAGLLVLAGRDSTHGSPFQPDSEAPGE